MGNIDPQHSGSGSGAAAIEAARNVPLPEKGSRIVTVRPDLDSFGAMALLELRAESRYESLPAEVKADIDARIDVIADADKAKGVWPGHSALPSRENPWPQAKGSGGRTLALLGAAVADFRRPASERVQCIKDWLVAGTLPEEYAERVDRERTEMIAALEDGSISISVDREKGVAVVESTHRAATALGYSQAPVVVAVNPSFAGPDGPYRKYTICQYGEGYVALDRVREGLDACESGWGGSATILGSPQGISSQLELDEVLAAVLPHIQAVGRREEEQDPVGTAHAALQEFVEVDGIRVYGKLLEKNHEEIVAALQRIEAGPEAELHLVRHFTTLSDSYRRSLAGQTFARENPETGETETVVIDNAMIDEALSTKGSKFFADVAGLTNPRELIVFVRNEAIARAQAGSLPVFDGGFCEKILLSIEMGRTVGRDGVVAVESIDPAQTRLSQQSRGKLGEDDFLVTIAEGHPGVVSDNVSAVIGIIDGTPYIFTAYPGALAPDFPKDHQGADEVAYNKTYWEKHAFIL